VEKSEAAEEEGRRVPKDKSGLLIGPVLPVGFVRKRQAAQYIGVSVRTLTNLMRRRVVPYTKVSRKICLFRIKELDKALDRYRVQAFGDTV